MTETDRLREQGLMLDERRDIKARLGCLTNKARRIEVALQRAATAVRQAHVDNWSVGDDGTLSLRANDRDRRTGGIVASLDLPTVNEVAEFLLERQTLSHRLEELERVLSI